MENIQKPNCKLIGEDGNVFNLIGKASEALRKAGLNKQSEEMTTKIMKSGSYNEALAIITNYVEIE